VSARSVPAPVRARQGLQVTTDYIELVTLPNNNSFVIRVALENNAIQRSQGNGAGSSVQRRVVR
jgi:hypothetical protein